MVSIHVTRMIQRAWSARERARYRSYRKDGKKKLSTQNKIGFCHRFMRLPVLYEKCLFTELELLSLQQIILRERRTCYSQGHGRSYGHSQRFVQRGCCTLRDKRKSSLASNLRPIFNHELCSPGHLWNRCDRIYLSISCSPSHECGPAVGSTTRLQSLHHSARQPGSGQTPIREA